MQLNDASLVFEPESSVALGIWISLWIFRECYTSKLSRKDCPESLTWKLLRQFQTLLILPKRRKKGSEKFVVKTPVDMPDPAILEFVEEPFIVAQVITKPEYIGQIMKLAMDKRGNLTKQIYLTTTRVELTFEMPLAEIVFDFYDRLKVDF